jgi:hypothetical protein
MMIALRKFAKWKVICGPEKIYPNNEAKKLRKKKIKT